MSVEIFVDSRMNPGKEKRKNTPHTFLQVIWQLSPFAFTAFTDLQVSKAGEAFQWSHSLAEQVTGIQEPPSLEYLWALQDGLMAVWAVCFHVFVSAVFGTGCYFGSLCLVVLQHFASCSILEIKIPGACIHFCEICLSASVCTRANLCALHPLMLTAVPL